MVSNQIEKLPLYIFNINNQSPGVACNALKYIAKYYKDIKFLSNGVTPVFTRKKNIVEKPERDETLDSAYYCLSRNNNNYNFKTDQVWERDEFPPNSVKDGWIGGKPRISVTCVDAADNWIDGQNLNRFYEAYRPNNPLTLVSSAYMHNDWRYYIPNMKLSGTRGPVPNDGSFYVLINMHKDTNCALYTQQYLS